MVPLTEKFLEKSIASKTLLIDYNLLQKKLLQNILFRKEVLRALQNLIFRQKDLRTFKRFSSCLLPAIVSLKGEKN